MKKIKFIYFDIGGVMLEWTNYFRTATKKFGIDYEQFKKLWSRGNKIWDEVTRGKISPQDFWNMAIKKFNLKNASNYNFVESWMNDYKPRKEVHELAKELSKKYKVGLLSNLYRGMMPRLIELGMVADIDYSAIILSYETGQNKNSKKIFELATEKSGVEPGEILLVDDRVDSLENAKSVGWQTFWFDEKNIEESVDKLRIIFL